MMLNLTFDFWPPGSFVSSWVKYYCTYQREPRRVTMVTFDPRASGKLVSSSSSVGAGREVIDQSAIDQ